MSALYYLGIIEGVAQARGEDAYPVKFWHALKMLGEELKSPCVIKPEMTLPKITRKALAMAESGVDEAEELSEAPAEGVEKKRQWSPEARARAAQRKADRLAREKSTRPSYNAVDNFIKEKGVTVIPAAYAKGSG